MMGTQHNLPMTMHIAKEELRQALISKIALEITKQRIKGLLILMFLLITSGLLMMSINHGIENHVVFCGFYNRVVAKCWKRMAIRKRN